MKTKIIARLKKRLEKSIKTYQSEAKKAAKGKEGRLFAYARDCETRSQVAFAALSALYSVKSDEGLRPFAKWMDTRRKEMESRAKRYGADGNYAAAHESMTISWEYNAISETVERIMEE